MVRRRNAMLRLASQFTTFFGVGVAAAVVHYGVLVFLVEGPRYDVVPSTLAGYVAGGVVSYWLNRRHTYRTERSHVDAGLRFAFVALVGFLLTWLLMYGLVDRLGLRYLLAQLLTTGVILVWSFFAHKVFSFADG